LKEFQKEATPYWFLIYNRLLSNGRDSLHILEEMLEKMELFVQHKIRKTLMTNEAKMGLSVPKQTQNICLDFLKSVV